MKNIKKIIKISLYIIILFFILTLIFTILENYNIINYKTKNIMKMIIPMICLTFGGYKIGKKSDKNGWLEGIKLSVFILIIMTITTLFLKAFKVEYLIYLIILTISGIFGSIIGINKK